MDEIDECVRRVLRLKERLGLFDDPYRRGANAESAETIAARRRLARDVGAKSLVLVKNADDMLPLREGVRRVVVLGPLADAWREMRGPWAAAGYEEPSVTVLAGLRAALPNARSRARRRRDDRRRGSLRHRRRRRARVERTRTSSCCASARPPR